MTKYAKRFGLRLLTLLAIVLCSYTLARASETLDFAIYDNTAPYYLFEESRKPSGIITDVISLTFERLGLTPSFVHMAYRRSIASLQTGGLDGAAGLSVNEGPVIGMPEALCVGTPFVITNWGSYALAGSQKDAETFDYTGKVVGVYQLLDVQHLPARLVDSAAGMETYRTIVRMMQSLKAKRIDVAVVDQGNARYWAEALGVEIKPVQLMGRVAAHICFSQHFLDTNEGYVEQYRRAQHDVFSSGQLERLIKDKYDHWFVDQFAAPYLEP